MITLICCTCGDKIEIERENEPRFGFEFYDVVKNAGWVPALDIDYGRALCFCSKQCRDKQITKAGYFRKYLIKAPKSKDGNKNA